MQDIIAANVEKNSAGMEKTDTGLQMIRQKRLTIM